MVGKSILILVMSCISVAVYGQICNGYQYKTPESSYTFNVSGNNLLLPVTAAEANVLIDSYTKCTNQQFDQCFQRRAYKEYRETKYFYACPGWLYQPQPDPLVIQEQYDITGPDDNCFGPYANRNTVVCELVQVSNDVTLGTYNFEYVKQETVRLYRTAEYAQGANPPTTYSLRSTTVTFTKVKNVSLVAGEYRWGSTPPTSLCPSGSINFKNYIVGSAGAVYSIVSGGGTINSTTGVYQPGAFTGTVKVRAQRTFSNGGATNLEHSFAVNGIANIESTLPATICSDAAAFSLNSFFSFPEGVSVTYSSPTHAASVSGNFFTPSFAGHPSAPVTVTIRAQVTASGCTGLKDVTLKITPGGWSINTLSDFQVCKNGSPVSLSASPANGGNYTASWSGTGVSGNQFNPGNGAIEENTEYALTYNVNNQGCAKSKVIKAFVNPVPVLSVTLSNVTPGCGSGSINLLQAIGPKDGENNISSGITWSSSSSALTGRISGNVLNTSGLAFGSYPITLAFSNATSCQASITLPAGLVINSNGIAEPVVKDSVNCENGIGYLTVSNYDPDNDYLWYSSSTGGPTVGTGRTFETPYLTTSTSYWVETKKLTCSSGRKKATVVIQNYEAEAGPNIKYCLPQDAVTTLSGSPAGGTWSGPGVTGSSFNGTSLMADQDYTLEYRYVKNGCVYKDFKTVSIGFQAQINSSVADTVQPGQLVEFSHTYNDAQTSYWTFTTPEGVETLISAQQTGYYFYAPGDNSVFLYLKNSAGCDKEVVTHLEVDRPEVITDVEKDSEVDHQVYPNPFVREIKLRATAPATIGITLYSGNGQVIYSGTHNISEGENQLLPETLQNLAPGIYILRVLHGNSITDQRLFKLNP